MKLHPSPWDIKGIPSQIGKTLIKTQTAPKTEIWAAIPGYTGYSASNFGRIRRDIRIGTKGVIGLCASRINDKGYPVVAAKADGSYSKPKSIHQLVMLAFRGPCPEGLVVCHEDGVKTNVALENLRYDTQLSNSHDCVRHGTRLFGETAVGAKLKEPQVLKIIGLLNGAYTYKAVAAMCGCNENDVKQIAHGKTWKHLTGGIKRVNTKKNNGGRRTSKGNAFTGAVWQPKPEKMNLEPA